MNPKRTISVQLKGMEKDNGDVEFSTFIQQLDIIKKALSETRKLVSNQAVSYFKVVDLQHKSPAKIILEAVPTDVKFVQETELIVDKFFRSIDEVVNNIYPQDFRYETFQSFKNITSLREKNKLSEISISRNGSEQTQLDNFSEKIESIMGEDEKEFGSYTGHLEALNIHRQNLIYIYPSSQLPKLKCRFSSDLKEKILRAVGHYVTVFGEKKYKPKVHSSAPYEMKVIDIEVHPLESEITKLKDLKGRYPEITEGKSSEEYVRDIRNGWEN